MISTVKPSSARSRDLYGVSPETVEVGWTRAASASPYSAPAKRSFMPSSATPTMSAPEFACAEEDPVAVSLTDDERRRLELTV